MAARKKLSPADRKRKTTMTVVVIMAAITVLPWIVLKIEQYTGKDIVPKPVKKWILVPSLFIIPAILGGLALFIALSNPILGALFAVAASLALIYAFREAKVLLKSDLTPVKPTMTTL